MKIKKKRRVLRNKKSETITLLPDDMPIRSAATLRILGLTHSKHLISALQRGVSVPNIVQWFDREGWAENMSSSTFTQYLYKFKVECADLLRDDRTDAESYDFYVGVSIPVIDTDVELDKLILLQKRRISTDVKTEITIGKLLDNTYKEIAVMGELLKQKAGKSDENAGRNYNDSQALRTLRVNEADRDKMQDLTDTLFKELTNASKKAGNTQKKVRTKS